jgi:hypothetical protein
MVLFYPIASQRERRRCEINLQRSARLILEEDQAKVISGLNIVLTQHRPDVIRTLGSDYGLESVEPSHFSLEIAERLQLRESCDLLLRSESYQRKMTRFTKSNPARTTQAIETLHCRSS